MPTLEDLSYSSRDIGRLGGYSTERATAMTKMHAMWVLVPALLFAVFAGPKDAAAEDETFRITSLSESRVNIKFFSQDRHVVWPGADKHWNLYDYKEHTYNLACVTGEQICYGAWVEGNANRYWGVGSEGKHTCTSCCSKCGGGDPRSIQLRSPIHR
jgi:hypothetical protein